MSRNKYNFKQSELYTIARLILSFLTEVTILNRFTAFKGKYTPAWVTARLLQVDDAEDLPDEEARNAVHESARIQLLQMVDKALLSFRALERYIIEVVSPELQKPNIEAAGGTKYASAADSDFDACQQMLNSAVNYVSANEILLLNAGLNMPPSFKLGLETLLTDFNQKHTEFLNSEASSEVQTGEKIDANNDVYEQIVTSVNADAQVIFATPPDEATANQFVLEHQLFLVRGAGVAGIRVLVTDAATGNPVPGAKVNITPKPDSLETDAEGRAIQLQLTAGNHTVKVEMIGYTIFETTVTIEIGTVKRLNVALVPV